MGEWGGGRRDTREGEEGTARDIPQSVRGQPGFGGGEGRAYCDGRGRGGAHRGTRRPDGAGPRPDFRVDSPAPAPFPLPAHVAPAPWRPGAPIAPGSSLGAPRRCWLRRCVTRPRPETRDPGGGSPRRRSELWVLRPRGPPNPVVRPHSPRHLPTRRSPRWGGWRVREGGCGRREESHSRRARAWGCAAQVY